MTSAAPPGASKTAPHFLARASGRLAATLRRLMPTREEACRHRALRWLAPLLEREWLWRPNRRAVASGAALGVFFGLLIPVGQVPLAAAGAVLLRANLPAAALGTLVSNPFTVGPIYWLAYLTGEAILDLAEAGRNSPGAAVGPDDDGLRLPFGWLEQVANAGEPLMLGLALFAAGGAVLTWLAARLAWRLNVARRRRRLRATLAPRLETGQPAPSERGRHARPRSKPRRDAASVADSTAGRCAPRSVARARRAR